MAPTAREASSQRQQCGCPLPCQRPGPRAMPTNSHKHVSGQPSAARHDRGRVGQASQGPHTPFVSAAYVRLACLASIKQRQGPPSTWGARPNVQLRGRWHASCHRGSWCSHYPHMHANTASQGARVPGVQAQLGSTTIIAPPKHRDEAPTGPACGSARRRRFLPAKRPPPVLRSKTPGQDTATGPPPPALKSGSQSQHQRAEVGVAPCPAPCCTLHRTSQHPE